MKPEKIDMTPEAVTNRLKMMEQLWELSVNLMQAREIPDTKSDDKNKEDSQKIAVKN